MEIENNILKHHLKNVFFINGTAYAGKSTMCAMLAEKYGFYHYAENAHSGEHRTIANLKQQPQFCYQRNDWNEFFNRTPEEYEKWIYGGSYEESEMEIIDLIKISMHQKVIVDTIISVEVLREIADYNQVAILLSPKSMSVDRFFDRTDKNDILECIMTTTNPEKTTANFRACVSQINSEEHYREYSESGFFCLKRGETDTLIETFQALEKHFGLVI